MARDDNKTVLEGQAAIDLWLQGKEAWNKWVEENPIADVSFEGADFTKYAVVSFEGYMFPKGDISFSNAHFGEGYVTFSKSLFDEGFVSFVRSNFGKGDIDFSEANFGKGDINFSNANFGEGNVHFARAKFGETVNFSHARFGEGNLNFYNVRIGDGYVNFYGTRFGKGNVSFYYAQFGEGNVNFDCVQFGEGDVYFRNAKFGEGNINFRHAQFRDGTVNFIDTRFGKGDLNFMLAEFGEGDVHFAITEFGEGNVSFYDAQFGKGNVNFDYAQFGKGNVSFQNAQFDEGFVNFQNAQFDEGYVDFRDTHFGECNVYFKSTRFGEGNVSFHYAQFGNSDVCFESINTSGQFNFSAVTRTAQIRSLSFKFATFDGPVSLDGNSFNCVPDFTNTKLSHQLSLSHFSVKAKTSNKSRFILKILIGIQKIWFGSPLQYSKAKSALGLSKKLSRKLPWLSKTAAADKQDIDRIRRLKELAETNKHHKLALDLHVEEMKCSRWIETPWYQLLTEFLFQKLGDYGRSVFRPTLSLVLLWLTCAPIYAYSSDKKDIAYDAMLFSFSQMFSVIPSSKDARSESSAALYGTLVNDKLVVDIPHAVFAVAGFQSLASIALVFLIGLALRNRFRI